MFRRYNSAVKWKVSPTKYLEKQHIKLIGRTFTVKKLKPRVNFLVKIDSSLLSRANRKKLA